MQRIRITIIIILAIVLTPACTHAFTISSGFGWRIHPIQKTRQFHTGIDIPMPYGTSIPAIMGGTVVWAASFKGYGNTVLLQHTKDVYTLYGHCAKIYVARGECVQAGKIIAAAGSTGLSTGPHLHLEYWVKHRYVDPLVLWQSTALK